MLRIAIAPFLFARLVIVAVVAFVACDSSHAVVVDDANGTSCHCTVCNPLSQNGCSAGEKCTWIIDQEDPLLGHVGCVPEGDVPPYEPCSMPTAGPLGYDECGRGTVCMSGECKPICDVNGGVPTCDENYACARHPDIFESGGVAIAGVCEPACNPLTQEMRTTGETACGSTAPSAPDRGCFGYDEFSCTTITPDSWSLTDRTRPRTNVHGHPFLDGCAPGFMPLLFESTGSTEILCTGYCAALEIDNTKPVANAKGDRNALGKLPLQASATAGNATCDIGTKGSEPSSQCRFFWPYLRDASTGELPVAFEQGPFRDTLGVCVASEFFEYDSNNDGTPDTDFPDCTTLPPRSGATPGEHDDAADWGCQLRANTTNGTLHAAIRNIRVPNKLAHVVRHTIR